MFYSYFTEGKDIGDNEELIKISKNLTQIRKNKKDLETDIDIKKLNWKNGLIEILALQGSNIY